MQILYNCIGGFVLGLVIVANIYTIFIMEFVHDDEE